jgi:hypothetical protein
MSFSRNVISKEFFKIFIGFCLSQKHHIYRFKFFPVNMRLIPCKRKIILHEIDSSFLIPCRRKIILHEIDSSFLIPCRRKIILHEIDSSFLILWKRKIILHDSFIFN